MSGVHREAWEDLFGDGGVGGDELTELEKISPSRVDAVEMPATGSGWLMLKSAGPGRGGSRAAAQGAWGRLGYQPFDLAHGSHRVTGWNGEIAGRLLKSDGEQRFTLSLCYPAYRPDAQRAQDSFRDVAGSEAVEQACWDYMLKHRKVGLMHEGGTGAGEVCESYIYRGPDWTLKAADGGEQTIRAGDWLLGVIWEPPAWARIRAAGPGALKGLSMQGIASRRKPSPETLARVRERT